MQNPKEIPFEQPNFADFQREYGKRMRVVSTRFLRPGEMAVLERGEGMGKYSILKRKGKNGHETLRCEVWTGSKFWFYLKRGSSVRAVPEEAYWDIGRQRQVHRLVQDALAR